MTGPQPSWPSGSPLNSANAPWPRGPRDAAAYWCAPGVRSMLAAIVVRPARACPARCYSASRLPMTIVQRIDKDLVDALKAREAERLGALRMVKTALKLRETEVPGSLGDEDSLRVLNTLIKQRRDSAEQFRAAGREDLAQKEEREAKVIQEYLPGAASPSDMARAVEDGIAETGATSPKDMGAVMKAARVRLQGKTVDGKALSDLVKS